jgi:tetratricopeptide (TPR) repeat protein
MNMKNPLTFLFLLLSLSSFGQGVLLESTAQLFGLYKQANQSLSIGDTKNAILIYDKLVDFYEHEGRQSELPESYLGMALSFALNGNYKESIRYHKKALRAHHRYRPNESALEIELNLGMAYQLAGKDRKAKRYLKSEFHG